MHTLSQELTVGNMDFAQKELKKRGWKRGKGLGKKENGMADAIKVNLKMDGTGLGFDHGEQFTFRWWDHMYGSALNKIDVDENDEGEVKVKSNDSCAQDNGVSNKRIPPKFLAKEMLYGRFVRGTPATSASCSSDSDSSSEDERPSLTFEDTDEKLLAACGGRTAHKGARHGMGLSGKLARLEQQEAAFQGEAVPQGPTKRKSSAETIEAAVEEKPKKVKKSKKKKRDIEVKGILVLNCSSFMIGYWDQVPVLVGCNCIM